MKILIVIPSLSKEMGGLTTSVLNYYKGLVLLSRVKITVASTVLQDEINSVEQWAVQNNNFKFFTTSDVRWRYSKHLNKFLKENIQSYDIVWIHAIWLAHSYFTSKYCLRYNIPYVITLHGLLDPYSLKQKALKKKIYWGIVEKMVLSKASAIHCLTDFEQYNVQQISDTKTFVVPNGIEEEAFVKKEYDKLQSICFIGRFHKQKALDLLIKAIAKIDNLKLVIAGSGEKKYEEYIVKLIEELEVGNKIEYVGFANRQKKSEIMRQSKFIIVPSYSEELSLVALEAISESLPVLITEQSHFDEIKQYNAGMVMENNDPDTIKRYILKMLESDIEAMSKNAHALAMDKFSIDSVSEKMLGEIEKIINGKEK